MELEGRGNCDGMGSLGTSVQPTTKRARSKPNELTLVGGRIARHSTTMAAQDQKRCGADWCE